MKRKRNRRLNASVSPAAVFVAVTTAALSYAYAADVVWDGNTDSDGGDGVTFDSGLNWSTDANPSAATPDNAVFNGTVSGPLALSYGGTMGGAIGNAGVNLNLASTQTDAVSVDSGAVTGSFRLGGINLAAGAGPLTIGDGLNTFNITLGGVASTQTFTNASTNAANLNSDVVFGLGGAAAHLLHFTGSGDWSVASSMAFASGGTGAIYKTGTGTLTLSGGGALKEGITVNGGTVYSAVLKEGTTVFNAGNYSNNNGTNNGEFVVGGLDTVGTDSQVTVNNAVALTGIDWLSIGRGNGVGTTSSNLTLNNTSSLTTTNMSGGYNAGNATTAPKGVVTLNGSSSLSVANIVNIGESPNSNITLNVNDTATFSQTANANQTSVGMANGASGTINVNGGTASFHRDLGIGQNGTSTGKLVLNSGTVHVATTTERWLKIGEQVGASGQIDVNGGTLNLNTNTDIRFSTSAATTGTNVVNLNAGAITGHTGNNNGVPSLTSVVDLNNASTSTANNTFNLNGGTLTIGQVITNNDGATAAFNFNGGTLKASGTTTNFVNLGGANQKVYVKGGGAVVDSNSFNVRVVDAMLDGGGNGGLSKLGAGTLTLSGANTFTGPVSITGGSVVLADLGELASSSGVTVNGAGAKFVIGNTTVLGATTPVVINQGGVDGNGEIDSLTVADDPANVVAAGNGAISNLVVNNLTFQGDAQLNLRATGSGMDQSVIVPDSLTTTPASGVVTVNVTNTAGLWSSSPTGWDYVLIDHFGASWSGNASHFAIGTLTPALAAGQSAMIVDTGDEIVLRVTGNPLVWTGSSSADWNTTSNNWLDGVTPSAFSSGKSVLFEDGASELGLNLTENVEPGLVQFSNFIDDYTISSSGGFGINGSAALAVDGGGMVTIQTVNSYTGSTTIVDGALVVSGSGTIGSSSSIDLGTLGELVLDPSGSVEYANPITGSGTTSPFVGTAAITKQGAGTLTLSGTSTFTGSFALQAGQLNLNSAGALGAGPGAFLINGGAIDNTSGGTINMAPNKPVTLNTDLSFIGSNNLYLSNGGVTLSGNRTVNVQAGTFGMGAPADGGTGYQLTKTGPGTLVLNGGNIRGNLDVQGGIVGLNQDFLGGAPVGTGILQNAGNVGTKWTFWYGPGNVSSNLLIRDNDGTNQTQLGLVKRGSGTLTLTNPLNNTTAQLSADAGTFELLAGTYKRQAGDGTTLTGDPGLVGWDAGANGRIIIDGATVNYNNQSNADGAVYRQSLNIGNNATGAGAVRLKSGSFTTYRQLAVGWTNGSFGGFTQTGGNANVGGFLAVGLGTAQGTVNLAGGNFSQAGPVTNGAGAGGIGILTVSNNAVYNLTAAGEGIWLGENGRGEMNVLGGASVTLPATNNGIQLGRNTGSSGILNLLGGTTTVQKVYKGVAAGTLNFNGGALAANTPTTTFLAGLTNAYVHSGGGTVNNGGNAITIGQALIAPTGNGVSAAGLVVSGSGFIDTPIVTITGDGTGATAIANVDAGGNLTGVTITNPGVGYLTPPTFTLSGGGIGNTGSIGGTATLVPNVSGGMAFTGAAVTTLTGGNTYSGNTTIGTGTTVVVANGATVTVAPSANLVSSKVTGAGTISIDGKLRLDLGSANLANGNSWTLVDVTTPIYNPVTFRLTDSVLGDFVPQGDGVTHVLVDGDNTWTFSETSGTLSLSVAASVVGYDLWIGGFGLDPADQDPTDDPDGDGVKNELEYALGRNPSVAEGATTTVSKSGSNLLLTFKRSDLAVSNGDVAISVEYGTNLASWSAPVTVPASSGVAGGITFTITDGTPNDTVVASIPTGGATKFFARVKAVK